jgi:hypothetical protein
MILEASLHKVWKSLEQGKIRKESIRINKLRAEALVLVVVFLVSLGGVSPLGTSATVGLLYQPRMIDDDYGAVGGMRIGKGNRSIGRKPAPVPLCPPQIPHDLTWDRTRTAAVGSQRLTA